MDDTKLFDGAGEKDEEEDEGPKVDIRSASTLLTQCPSPSFAPPPPARPKPLAGRGRLVTSLKLAGGCREPPRQCTLPPSVDDWALLLAAGKRVRELERLVYVPQARNTNRRRQVGGREAGHWCAPPSTKTAVHACMYVACRCLSVYISTYFVPLNRQGRAYIHTYAVVTS